jgi:MFS family permease
VASGVTRSATQSLTALYFAAPFSMGYVDFYTFLMPLYALSLGFDAAEVGILVGARSIVAMFLSIHVGALMDRFGTRKITLFFVWTSMILAPLFPLVPWFWSLLVLQLVTGAAVSFAWSGAQTLIAQLASGEARHLGRFTFFARLGSTTAPLLGGVAWDFGGAWLSYSVGIVWGGVLIVALLCSPEVWPRLSDHWASLMLLAVPAITLSLAIMAMRNSTYGIQTSVYVVYLRQVGLVGTTIGILFSAAEIASGFGALFAGRAMGLGNAQRTMLSGTAVSILLIALTPFLGGILALLLLFQVMRGWLEGVIQPLVLSVQARAAGPHQQGAVVGLRQTGQRFTSIVVPPIMGTIADRSGVSASFLVIGGFMLLLCASVAMIIRRVGRRRAPGESLAGATD